MSAEVLRWAAALMRERAGAASPGPWAPSVYGTTVSDPAKFLVRTAQDDLPHIASWHPAVALAVADWLDTAGADLWAHGPLCDCGSACHDCDDDVWQPHVRRALAVARAYLGETP